jgi:SnoaL-like domain
MPAVEDFVTFYAARDWNRLATCFSPTGFERIGPYGDVIDSSQGYLDFLRRVVPTLKEGYELKPVHIAYAGDTVIAELIEHLEVDGKMKDLPEAIIFRLDDKGLIKGMHLYLQQPGGEAPVGGREAMGKMPD